MLECVLEVVRRCGERGKKEEGRDTYTLVEAGGGRWGDVVECKHFVQTERISSLGVANSGRFFLLDVCYPC